MRVSTLVLNWSATTTRINAFQHRTSGAWCWNSLPTLPCSMIARETAIHIIFYRQFQRTDSGCHFAVATTPQTTVSSQKRRVETSKTVLWFCEFGNSNQRPRQTTPTEKMRCSLSHYVICSLSCSPFICSLTNSFLSSSIFFFWSIINFSHLSMFSLIHCFRLSAVCFASSGSCFSITEP